MCSYPADPGESSTSPSPRTTLATTSCSAPADALHSPYSYRGPESRYLTPCGLGEGYEELAAYKYWPKSRPDDISTERGST